MARQETYVADLVNRLNRLKDKEKTFDVSGNGPLCLNVCS